MPVFIGQQDFFFCLPLPVAVQQRFLQLRFLLGDLIQEGLQSDPKSESYQLAQKYQNLCVVGDDDQSIYAFRGAVVENILSFDKSFDNAKLILGISKTVKKS